MAECGFRLVTYYFFCLYGVDIENEQGDTKRFRIVGYDEIYERMDYISIDSPMARALLRKEVDDEVIVQTPGGEMCWSRPGVSSLVCWVRSVGCWRRWVPSW